MTTTAFVGNTNLLRIDGLRYAPDGAYVNNATVQLIELKDAAGVAVTGVTLPISLVYVPGSDGCYEIGLSDAVAFVAGTTYYAKIKAMQGINVAIWNHKFYGRTRVQV